MEAGQPPPCVNPLARAKGPHADYCLNQPPSYWDYESMHIQYGSQDPYEVVRKVGRGKYSEVFEGINVPANKRCCIKVGEICSRCSSPGGTACMHAQ